MDNVVTRTTHYVIQHIELKYINFFHYYYSMDDDMILFGFCMEIAMLMSNWYRRIFGLINMQMMVSLLTLAHFVRHLHAQMF